MKPHKGYKIIKHQQYSDKWFRIPWNNAHIGCCDCGLVHCCDFKVVGKRLYKKVSVVVDLTEEARHRFPFPVKFDTKKGKDLFVASQFKGEPIRVKRYKK